MNELEDLFEALQPTDVRSYCDPLCRRMSHCLISSNTQVVERVLYLWNNPSFEKLFVKDKVNVSILAPLMYGALRRCMEEASLSQKQMAQHVIGVLFDADRTLLERLATEYSLM